MNIPKTSFTLESFLDYIVNNVSEVFGSPRKRKWLKVHLVYVENDWKSTFEGFKLENLGEITRITFPDNHKEGENSLQKFYLYQWTPGLILMFTSSKQEDYERTLKQFISHKRGISESWIAPSLFQDMKNFLINKHDAVLYRFIGKRRRYWKFPSQTRPEHDRRVSYSGEDTEKALKELQVLYGIIPTSIDMRIRNFKLQINRNGLFLIRHINRHTIGILQEVIERIIAEQIRLRKISEKFIVLPKKIQLGQREIKVSTIVAGKIILPGTRLTELMISGMFKETHNFNLGQMEKDNEDDIFDFSFVDTRIIEEPLIFAATVVDEIKGSVFGISGNDMEIALIPKHRTTFETFISFFNLVTENFDESANLTMFSEGINVRR